MDEQRSKGAAIVPPTKEVSVIKPDSWLQIKALHREGRSKSAIARELGIDRKTVRRALAAERTPAFRPAARSSKLDSFKDYIRMRLADGMTNAVKLLRELKAQGYTGSISILRDCCAPLRAEQQRQASLRFETVPGEQAQIDWGHAWSLDALGKARRCYCFTMLLGFSRCLYAEFTQSMDLIALLRCHIHAFDYFGGLTRTVLYDNMKQVVLYRDAATDQLHFNPRFLDFACCYGFQPKACRPYRPQTKGKVENSIKYIRGSFLLGDPLLPLGPLNDHLRVWLDTVANVRIHATTREVPFERLEREHLLSLPAVPYDTSLSESRLVTSDCLISYQGNRYSVPARYVRRPVTVRDSDDGQLRVYHGSELIAAHRLSAEKGRMVINPDHTKDITRSKPDLRLSDGRSLPRLPALVAGPSVLLSALATEVARRPLAVYESLAEEAR